MFGPAWDDLNKTRRTMDALDFWRYMATSKEAQAVWLPFYEDGEKLLMIWLDLNELLALPNETGGSFLEANKTLLNRMGENLTPKLKSSNAIEEMIPYLVLAYREEWSLLVKEWIVKFIKSTKSKSAIFYFANFIKDSDDLVRYDAINSLGMLEDKRAVPYLLESIYDVKDNIVGISVWSLIDILKKKAIPILKQKFEDPKSSHTLKREAFQGIGKIGGLVDIPYVEKFRMDPEWSGYVWDIVRNIHSRNAKRTR